MRIRADRGGSGGIVRSICSGYPHDGRSARRSACTGYRAIPRTPPVCTSVRSCPVPLPQVLPSGRAADPAMSHLKDLSFLEHTAPVRFPSGPLAPYPSAPRARCTELLATHSAVGTIVRNDHRQTGQLHHGPCSTRSCALTLARSLSSFRRISSNSSSYLSRVIAPNPSAARMSSLGCRSRIRSITARVTLACS